MTVLSNVDMSAARIVDAIQQDALTYSGGDSSDDTVALVLKVPRHEVSGQPWQPPGSRKPSVPQPATSGRLGVLGVPEGGRPGW
jgi:hypothetical protein